MAAEAGVAADQLDQIERAGTPRIAQVTPSSRLATSDVRRPPREMPFSPIMGVGLLCPDPGQQAPDIPHRLSGTVDFVEHVLTGERDALRQAPRTRAVHGKDGKHDIRPRSECRCHARNKREVERRPSHLRSRAHRPAMAEARRCRNSKHVLPVISALRSATVPGPVRLHGARSRWVKNMRW